MGVDCVIVAQRPGWMSDESIGAISTDFRKAMRDWPITDPPPWSAGIVKRASASDACEGLPELSADTTTLLVETGERAWSPKYRRGNFIRIAAACEFFRRRGWTVFVGDDGSDTVTSWNVVREGWTDAWAMEANEYP